MFNTQDKYKSNDSVKRLSEQVLAIMQRDKPKNLLLELERYVASMDCLSVSDNNNYKVGR